MAKITETSIVKVGNGILHPKLINRFRVIFILDDVKAAENLSAQVVSVCSLPRTSLVMKRNETSSSVTYELDPGLTTDDIREFNVEFQDDVNNSAMKDLYELMGRRFVVAVQLLNGSDFVIEEYSFNGVRIVEVATNDLDYRGGSHADREVGAISFPTYLTSEFPDQILDLQRFLSSMKIHLPSGGEYVSPTVDKIVFFNFDTVYHTFFTPTPNEQVSIRHHQV